MIVATKYKRVIIYPEDPRMITTVIPTATVIRQGDKEVVAVPHRIDEVRVLNNLGFKVPSPITFYHEWGAPFDAFEAQRITAGMLTLNPRAYVCNELGTGKTQAMLWASDYLMKVGYIHRVLICSTLSTMERAWGDELFSSFPHRTVRQLYGSAVRRLKMLEQEADYYVINHDGLKVKGIIEALHARPDIDLVIVDELAVFRNSKSDRYKALERLINGHVDRKGRRLAAAKEWVWGATAKPTPNEPTDAWAQCKLITPGTVPMYFKQFREQTMFQKGPYTWIARPDAADTVANAMRPAVRFKRSQCYDMKEMQFETRHAPMTPEQAGIYKEMRDELIANYNMGQIKAVNEASKISKLVQIASGVVYGRDKEEIQLPCGPRLEVLDEVCEEASAKVIIFAPFRCTISMIAAFRRDRGKKVGVIHGGVSKAERDRIFREFQHGDIDELIAQPGTMAHGLTLTAADTIIWYAPIDDNDIYGQAIGRITRPNQKLTPVVVHIEGSVAERAVYRRLERKESFQNVLLEILQSEI